ncbi:M15 family metallopeptidase [Clostridium swellfunianum]|uniref:M15 family metallopeptidase n=1 Tax=Clostridium swellfunianum TaxID=1367462 RepID=UPI002030170E|nr:M15 family metallopeptidase [Clostridium swellfunianum]MCM0649111.1 M15 family metallopeptidase [Clostridium swellfunianum]
MKNWFKKILIFIMIAYGTLYIIGCTVTELKDKNNNGNEIDLNEKDRPVNQNNVNLDSMNTNSINKRAKLVLVNSEHGLSEVYKPEKLTIPNIPFAAGVDQEEKHVAGVIVSPLEKLVNAAKKEGVVLLGNSGYRSYKSQKETYNNRVKAEGKKLADAYVAKPGFSEHQTGLCMDITNKSGYFAKGTKEAEWLAENCHRFGFIIRYPYGKKSVTGIEYEPWHIRYVGDEAAKYIYDNEITLEEYLDK